MNFSALALVTSLAFVPAAGAETKNPNHPGVRRWTVSGVVSGMYAPSGSSLLSLAGRWTYPVHRIFDTEVTGGLLYFLNEPNQDHFGLFVESGGTLSGRFFSEYTRIGVFTTVGGATNFNAWMLNIGMGVELRFGLARELVSPHGFDGRVRVGARFLPSLNGQSPADLVYGVELAFGYGGGGPRVN